MMSEKFADNKDLVLDRESYEHAFDWTSISFNPNNVDLGSKKCRWLRTLTEGKKMILSLFYQGKEVPEQ